MPRSHRVSRAVVAPAQAQFRDVCLDWLLLSTLTSARTLPIPGGKPVAGGRRRDPRRWANRLTGQQFHRLDPDGP